MADQPPPYPGMQAPAGNASDPAKPGQDVPLNVAAGPDQDALSVSQWSSGLCGCFNDLPSCLITYFCGCVGHGMVYGRTTGEKWGVESLLWILGGCCCYANCWYCGAKRRKLVREKYGLPAEPCGDVCVNCCCMACAICQEWRELDRRGVVAAGNPF